MTCRDLAGACDVKFHAETFEEMSKLSQKHGREMFKKKDPLHLVAMEKMQRLMEDPNVMQNWMFEKQKEFDLLPED